MAEFTETEIRFPETARSFLRRVIAEAGGREVFFRARVEWTDEQSASATAVVRDVEVAARGTDSAAPAIVRGSEEWDLAIHNHPSGVLAPSDADVAVAAELGNLGVGFVIVANDGNAHHVVVPPIRRKERRLLDLDEVRAIFGAEGIFAESLPDYEARAGQAELAVEVARALNEDRVVAEEAGTGVGKSFAYLVPSILWATQNGERVVVSTGTIQLQEQLVAKDLPFLRRVLPIEFRYSLIKGRTNYACRRKAAEVKTQLGDGDWVAALESPESTEQLRKLLDWIEVTQDGSRSDLAWTPPFDVWEQVMSETDKTLRAKCDHYESCFYYAARRAASAANVIVANHHLYFADLSVRMELGEQAFDPVLPSYARVIFDEAHHLEDVAAEYFGVRVSPGGIRRRLVRMCSPDRADRGALRRVGATLRKAGDATAAHALEESLATAIGEAVRRIDIAIDDLRDRVEERVAPGRPRDREESRAVADAASSQSTHDETIRYRGHPNDEAFWRSCRNSLGAMRRAIAAVIASTGTAIEALKRARVPETKRDALALEFTSFASRLDGVASAIDQFSEFDDRKRVRWLTARPDRRRSEFGALLFEFAAAPVRVAEDLRRSVFEAFGSVVLTSATLAVAGRPDFFASRLGLDGIESDRFRFREFGSPFDFERQALVVVPSDLPPPDAPQYPAAVPDAVLELARASGGRAFVLFTSYALLRRCYDAIADRLRAEELVPLRQGDMPRSALLEAFRASGAGVLFGTDSFWEGVDVRGRALECVIITRLPFRVPTEPLQEARVEELEARGEHPFSNFTLPQAVLKFKQGFGRLIRSTTDRGVVAILDRRIMTKPYGRTFVRSLPPVRLIEDTTAGVAARVRAFFAE